jgi:protein tyrosine phosphatase (PTP) superfamily phosphohydrolase (DUF442 family)
MGTRALTHPARALQVEGLANARDLGGLRRCDGTETPRGVFYRSEHLGKLTTAGWEELATVGVRTVVDLRQPGEREQYESRCPSGFTVMEVDLGGLGNTGFWEGYWDNGLVGTALYFVPHLQAMPERAVAALSAVVSAPPGGVLFHCMGGRDRTGMIAMLLLAAARTHSDEIVDDYLESVRRAGLLAATVGRPNAELAAEAVCAAHGTTTEGAFRAALAALDLDAVLSAGGMRPADRQALMSWRGHLS